MVKCPNLGFLSYKPNVGGWRLAECKHAVMGQPALRRARAVASCPWWTSSSTLKSLGTRGARLGEPYLGAMSSGFISIPTMQKLCAAPARTRKVTVLRMPELA